MSLIVTVWVNDGLVLASDSRISFVASTNGVEQPNLLSGHYFDTEYKTYLCRNNVGISTCGDASINSKPLTGYLENFVYNEIKQDMSVKDTAIKLKEYFTKISTTLNCIFHIAGYDKQGEQFVPMVYRYLTQEGKITPLNTSTPGAVWDGQTEFLSKLIKSQFLSPNHMNVDTLNIDLNGTQIALTNVIVLERKNTDIYPELNIPWQFMNLQDAIDFARYAIQTTIDTMKFTNINKTVGGPIDILTIKATDARWISHKKLH